MTHSMLDVGEDDLDSEQLIECLPRRNREALAEKHRSIYARGIWRLAHWLANKGKDPEIDDGYASDTVEKMLYRIHDFYLYVQDRKGFTMYPSTAIADEYMGVVARSDNSGSHKDNVRKSLKALYKWMAFNGKGEEWSYDRTFEKSDSSPWDIFSSEECERIRLEILADPLPPFDGLDDDERDPYRSYLSQKFGVPKEEVGREEWRRINGYKIPSLIHTALDLGLRPKEVKRFKVSWLDLGNDQILIPKNDAVKSEARQSPVIQPETSDILENWLDERESYPEYDDTDVLWLNQSGNPFTTRTLNPLLRRVLDYVDIDVGENRRIVWTSIRRTTATYMANEVGLKHAKEQLRHNSIVTTLRYVESQPDVRREGLERMFTRSRSPSQQAREVGQVPASW